MSSEDGDDENDPTHVEDYGNYPASVMRRQSERYAMNQEIDMTEIERALRPKLPATFTLAAILEERKTLHGDFTDDASVSQMLKSVMRDGANWRVLTPVQAEALENIATKIGRVLSGDPNHKDHWSDIQGYARLVEERL